MLLPGYRRRDSLRHLGSARGRVGEVTQLAGVHDLRGGALGLIPQYHTVPHILLV